MNVAFVWLHSLQSCVPLCVGILPSTYNHAKGVFGRLFITSEVLRKMVLLLLAPHICVKRIEMVPDYTWILGRVT